MPSRFELLIAEKKRREARAGADNEVARAFAARMAKTVEKLRSEYHDLQARFCVSTKKRRIAKTTRRSGKTRGGARETMARALEQPGFRAVYCNTTKAEAIRLVWRSERRTDGWLDLLRLFGLKVTHKREKLEAGLADVFVDETQKTIDFANGSQLAIFCADDQAALEKFRGVAKHVLWVDEAQKFTYLETFLDDIAGASMTDFDGEIWLTGTPGEFCAGFFYEATKEADKGDRLTGWEVHEWSILDNPFFGVDARSRFDRAVRSKIVEKKPPRWDGTDEDWIATFLAAPPAWYIREYLGRWTLTGALFVYPVHEVPGGIDSVFFAPQRLRYDTKPLSPEGRELESIDVENLGWLDLEAALADLPTHYRKKSGKKHPITWLLAASFDFGFDPDPFAISINAFSPDVADVYEIWSWKQVRVHVDDQRDAIRSIVAALPNLVVCVGDPGGLKSGDLEGWRERLGLAIEDADKHSKRQWIRLLGGEITSGRFHYREDSPLLREHEHLLWLVHVNKKTGEATYVEHKTRMLPDKSIPGNHCSDANLYGFRHMIYRKTEFGTYEGQLPQEQRDAREEARMERWVDRATETASLQEDDPAAYAAGDYGADYA